MSLVRKPAAMAATVTTVAAIAVGAAGSAVTTTATYPLVQQLTPAQAVLLSTAAAPAPRANATYRLFTPPGIQSSYNLPALYDEGLTGAGRTIAIVDSFGYDQAADDLKAFSTAYGLPLMCGMPDVACQPGMAKFSTLQLGNHQVKAPPDGSQAPQQEASNAWSVEVALDIEYAHTVAPGANILLVTTPTAETLGVQGLPQMMDAEQYVVDHHLADVVTQSFGTAEGAFGSTASLQNLRHAFHTGTAAGITFLASSGDNGSTGSAKQPVGQGGTTLPTPEVGWPASDPLVTAVGGTNLCTSPFDGTVVDSVDGPATPDDSCRSGDRETAWNGSGGGFSHVFARPDYQSGVAAVPSGARGVPDISMNASCGTYVVVLDTAPGYGGYYRVCGTSEASPMFAGVVAIADQAAGHDLGNINDALYNGSLAGTYDVTKGDNVQAGSGVPGYSAGPGWDAVTGQGTPADAQAFVHSLAGR
jgi:subtilase family serine protease